MLIASRLRASTGGRILVVRKESEGECMHIVSKAPAIVAVAICLLCGCGGGRPEATETYVLVTTNTKIPYWQGGSAGARGAARGLWGHTARVRGRTLQPQAGKGGIRSAAHTPSPPRW